MLTVGAEGGAGVAEVEPPSLPANTPASTPPAASAATAATHLILPRDAVGPGCTGRPTAAFDAAAPRFGSTMYWNDTVPARACSFEAITRI